MPGAACPPPRAAPSTMRNFCATAPAPSICPTSCLTHEYSSLCHPEVASFYLSPMFNAHCHRPDASCPSLVCCAQQNEWSTLAATSFDGRRFYGIHPWFAENCDLSAALPSLTALLAADPIAGVGEIGLDRLHTKTTTLAQKNALIAQLEIAAKFSRPIVLHGAKCWGEVVKAVKPFASQVPAMLFHGFSRSEGLINEIISLNGFISIGAAVLNDHAINYRAMIRKIPQDRLLLETDTSEEPLRKILEQTAALLDLSPAALEQITDANIQRFIQLP